MISFTARMRSSRRTCDSFREGPARPGGVRRRYCRDNQADSFDGSKAAEDARRNAEEKATLIVENAEREAAVVLDRAEEKIRSQQKRLEDLYAQETAARARFKAMLEAYLEMLEDTEMNA